MFNSFKPALDEQAALTSLPGALTTSVTQAPFKNPFSTLPIWKSLNPANFLEIETDLLELKFFF
jgi:hypothetical protein